MQTYFIRFKNGFESKYFMDNQEKFFTFTNEIKTIVHNVLFIEVQLKRHNIFYYHRLMTERFPNVEITRKLISKGKIRYIKL